MTAREVYEGLCKFYRSGQREGIAPSQLGKECEIREIPDSGQDVISHTEYITGDGKVVVIYTSYDHSRTCQLRPDSNNFEILLYDNVGNQLEQQLYTYWDKE